MQQNSYSTAIWALLKNAAPKLVGEIETQNRRFMHEEFVAAVSPDALKEIARLVRECDTWDEGPTVSIPNDSGTRFIEVYDDPDDGAYPETNGLCLMVQKQNH